MKAPFSGLGFPSSEINCFVGDMPFISPPFVDVPAASSDPPLPPETGQHCGTGGGEETAAD